MEGERNCLRRITHEETEFSAQSILRAMEKFVKAVNVMDETILVPSRLMDLKISDEITGKDLAKSRRRLAKDLNNTDLYSVYNMINGVKNELLWGQSASNGPSEGPEETTQVVKGHIRRPSTVSVASTSSAVSTTSDTDSETGIENDIGSESEDYAQTVSDKFKHHLHGLFNCLDHMTEAASYLTARYQIDIGGSV
ncbi:mid1-interacting protein 1-B isoform X2 [Neocloeon triangulifer]|uniref:mid1-interacting protein 1-B isoform X2 n=2 Tax=Neocloeon triangulifer TaxID=2078957 RepID=UPI00286EDE2D|nr:mid1-interacting protein 1-B isoform X2 [Neocloeon triangulifer]XP_059480163.1 mid1-interacting protein 1-B isoform X2 [Neocloeon triangulifer]XP_059480164.1 mid1-interacting protein 1-B isoform X2 [Neocloeon triangulifer]